MYGRQKILFVGTDQKLLMRLSPEYDTEVISASTFLETVLFSFVPDAIIFDSLEDADVRSVRSHERLVQVPVLIVSESFDGFGNVAAVERFPRVLMCNTAVAETDAFLRRLAAILQKKAPLLPAKTGSIVKHAIFFVNKQFSQPLSREQIAAHCHVSEDYLTRVFRREMGLPLWEYVNCFRLAVARTLLLETALAVGEVAKRCGFTDAAYFSRLFRTRYGIPPTQVAK